ncbi:hypothetical protein M3J09_005936 [Ascochyta lentis]
MCSPSCRDCRICTYGVPIYSSASHRAASYRFVDSRNRHCQRCDTVSTF